MDLWRSNKSGERIKFQVEFEQNMETRWEESVIAFREHKTTNENQIGELTNRLVQAFTEGERGMQIPSPASEIHTPVAEGNRSAESDTESKRREPIFSPASTMQTAAKLNSRAESNNGTHIPSLA